MINHQMQFPRSKLPTKTPCENKKTIISDLDTDEVFNCKWTELDFPKFQKL